jgi:hypothetical protein
MKTHIGPIYLILGLMAVSSLAIGASETPAPRTVHVVHAQALLPSPSSFRLIGTTALEEATQARVEAKVAKALAAARARKAG